MSKWEMRKRLASLSFSDKVRILEKLRDRSRTIASSGLRHEDTQNAAETGKEELFCTCLGWEPCACGNQPPYHCTWCCKELTPEQIAAARERGWYGNKER